MTGRFLLSKKNVISAFREAGFKNATINIKEDTHKGPCKGIKIEFALASGVRGMLHVKHLPDVRIARTSIIKKAVAAAGRSSPKP